MDASVAIRIIRIRDVETVEAARIFC